MPEAMHGAPTLKLVTCILPFGVAAGVLARLKQEQGIVEAHVRAARGIGRLTPSRYRSAGSQTEKEILSVVTPAERADALFAWLFHAARIDRPHGGILFMNALARATPFVLPDLPDES